jgi:3-oxoacyl-[acyl-carrier protein] reductase
MQRLAQPNEVASIAFLAGEAASFLTGQTLFVDGGASLGNL